MSEVTIQKVPNADRVSELWAAFKVLLSGKVDTSVLDSYATVDAVATAITTALVSYPTDTEMRSAISTALVDYMTASEVNDAIASAVASSSGLHYEVVETLPKEGDSKIIYLISNGNEDNEDADDFYDEWYYYNGKWNFLGTTKPDLSNYWSKDELKIMTAEELEELLV